MKIKQISFLLIFFIISYTISQDYSDFDIKQLLDSYNKENNHEIQYNEIYANSNYDTIDSNNSISADIINTNTNDINNTNHITPPTDDTNNPITTIDIPDSQPIDEPKIDNTLNTNQLIKTNPIQNTIKTKAIDIQSTSPAQIELPPINSSTGLNSCNIQIKIDETSSFASCLRYTFFPLIQIDPSQKVEGMVWDFGDGTTSNDENSIHMYTSPGTYLVTLTAIVVNQDGTCCSIKTETKIIVNDCPICELLQYNQIKISEYGSYRLFEPTVAHQTKFLYTWELFQDNTPLQVYKIRNVMSTVQNSIGLWMKLTVLYADSDSKTCCKESTKIELFKIER